MIEEDGQIGIASLSPGGWFRAERERKGWGDTRHRAALTRPDQTRQDKTRPADRGRHRPDWSSVQEHAGQKGRRATPSRPRGSR